MQILSHRGYWNKQEVIQKNSIAAIRTSLESGFGFESDLRDYRGKLVISHNIADEDAPEAESVMKMLKEYANSRCFAINIKADGLAEELLRLTDTYQITNYFTFDMSVPQMISYKEASIPFYSRQSEYEPEPVLYKDCKGVWIDAWIEETWITKELILRYISDGKSVCLVSPELHGRKQKEFWQRLKDFGLNQEERVALCTDMPGQAKIFFKE